MRDLITTYQDDGRFVTFGKVETLTWEGEHTVTLALEDFTKRQDETAATYVQRRLEAAQALAENADDEKIVRSLTETIVWYSQEIERLAEAKANVQALARTFRRCVGVYVRPGSENEDDEEA